MDQEERRRIFDSFREPKTIVGVKDKTKVYKINKVLTTFLLILLPTIFIVMAILTEESFKIDDTGYAWFIYTAAVLGTIAIVYIVAYIFCVIGKYIIRFDSKALIIENIGGMERFEFDKGISMRMSYIVRGEIRYKMAPKYYDYYFYIKQDEKEVEIPYKMMGEELFFDFLDNLIFDRY